MGAPLAVGLLLLLVAACASPTVQQATPLPAASQPPGSTAQAPAPTAPAPAASPTAVPAAPAATPTAVPLRSLKTAPEVGPVGTAFTLSGEGIPPGKPVEFFWATVDGTYKTKPSVETIEYYDRDFTLKRTSLGRATADEQGRVTASFSVPEDYGQVHDIFAVVDGKDVAKGGFQVVRTVTIQPLQGPVGTPITIEVKGLGWAPFENTMGVLYDNKYSGFISAVTTRGTARAVIRAAGPAGQHEIRVTDASAATPYLNTEQSPRKLPQFKFAFAITKDGGPPPLTMDWPDGSRVATSGTLTRTTVSRVAPAPGIKASLSSGSGPILSKITLQASGASAGAAVDIRWVSVKGNRVTPSGWNLTDDVLSKATVGQDGSLSKELEIPDDLGGWHTVRLTQGDKVLAEVPYFVDRSLVGVTPVKVKSGETFTVHVKGIGWTELDNGFAVTYDNAYTGYACGFNSQGDVTMTLQASGGPGTHLIDLYPMIFKGHGEGGWNYEMPQLTALQDQPGLALGYKLPIYRLAVEVSE